VSVLDRRLMIGGLLGAASYAWAGASFAQSRDDYPDSVKWDGLSKTKIGTDARGGFTASHPPSVAALAGKPFEITGFMLPLEEKAVTAHFILIRFPINCPFCDPSNPNESIEVFADKPVTFVNGAVKVKGMFTLQDEPGSGLFFRLSKANAIEVRS
jgi:uncharacterized protein